MANRDDSGKGSTFAARFEAALSALWPMDREPELIPTEKSPFEEVAEAAFRATRAMVERDKRTQCLAPLGRVARVSLGDDVTLESSAGGNGDGGLTTALPIARGSNGKR